MHVTVLEDVLNGPFDAEPPVLAPDRYRRSQPLAPPADLVRRACELLTEASLSLLQVGSGVVHAGAGELVRELAGALRAPVTASWGCVQAPVDLGAVRVEAQRARQAADPSRDLLGVEALAISRSVGMDVRYP